MYKNDLLIPKIRKIISEEFEKRNIAGETIVLHEKDIKACLGCFKCWIQTPGECIINDFARDVTKKMINSDYLIYLSPIVYGGYSAELKKAVDRSISLISPFFRVYNDEIHHEARYDKYPKLIVIGTLPEPDINQESIFKDLVERNVLNNLAPEHISKIIHNIDEDEVIKSKIEDCFAIVGEENV
jgi:multimeric flavodoxin WrbA